MKQGYARGHDYVEIGDIKWATMNVGAKDVTDPGLYFAWGETKGYSPEEVGKAKLFTCEDYKFGYYNQSKYNRIDNLTTLQPQDDPVHVNWRGGWRLPTRKEFVVLKKATISEWVYDYKSSGVSGLLVKDKNDASKELFFPAAGYGSNGSVNNVGSEGDYWSSSLRESDSKSAWFMNFNRHFDGWEYNSHRRFGFCGRGVLDV